MRSRTHRCRPFSARFLCLLLLVLGFGAYCYYNTMAAQTDHKSKDLSSRGTLILKGRPRFYEVTQKIEVLPEKCPVLRESEADIDTMAIFPTFEFQPSWLRSKEFWDKSFEDRYEKIHNDSNRPTLKVIVVPHSHNDPGWLKTFEQYFEWKTKHIINNIVAKLQLYPNMTFIWTEISFLSAWWETSHPVKRKALKKLIKEGRLEITTGGWVMPDEACTHIYALIDQFIEGHTWVKTNLGISPKTGWSIDPFGHGPTVPYLLDQSGLKGTIIQRIHYAWKQWLAQKQIEEFYWMSGWSTKKPSMVVHNQPFDIYSIKSTCGPHPSICLSFDFRTVPGEYSEYTAKHEEITDKNLHSKSKTLIEEYERIGTLTPHNVVLVPLGDDFRYEYPAEFDAQYTNYMKMFNYINSHKELFHADVQFGTPKDYFDSVWKRHKNIPTLKGDFFVYSDIFSEGKPAYWSGYYTTRPYIKILARQLEHHLRAAEILFTLVFNRIKQNSDMKYSASEKRLEKLYEQLIYARRNLGLFQHHDAITGTSKANVMSDYGSRLYSSVYQCARLQEAALSAVVLPPDVSASVLQSEAEWETYGTPPNKLQVSFSDRNKIVLFNPLAENRTEVITLRTVNSNVRVYDEEDEDHVPYQISPLIEYQKGQRHLVPDTFDLVFVATVPALSSRTYTLQEHKNASHISIVFCKDCDQQKSDIFVTKQMMPGDIQLENSVLKLLINRNTGFLKQIYRKDIRKKNVVEIVFGAYQSAQRHSGAYLFMPDYDSPEINVLHAYTDPNIPQDNNILIVSGPVYTEITTMYMPFLVHTARIFNVEHPVLAHAVLIENEVDFESPPKNRDTELFMKIQTDIQNGDVPEFYTDQNGFQYQKRVKVDKLGIEANYYPITTMAWLQDEETRLTLVTNHAQGAAAFEPGQLEVMLDRRSLYDDFRGIGEGVVDNKRTLFENWILLESMPGVTRHKRDTTEKEFQFPNERHFNPNQKENQYQVPSQGAEYLSRTLNYPVNVYLLDPSEAGDVKVKPSVQFVQDFPSGIHLVTLRTITDVSLELFPSQDAYMVVQRPGYSCEVGYQSTAKPATFTTNTKFSGVVVNNITSVSLTGLKEYSNLTSLRDIHLKPMEVRTYKIRF